MSNNNSRKKKITKKDDKPKKKGGRPPKLDYDSDHLYEDIYALAFNGASDDEIPHLLIDNYGVSVSRSMFDLWKRGEYPHWTQDENEYRSTRLVRVLTRARTKFVYALKNTYLKMALGKVKTTNRGKTKRHLVVGGVQTEDELVQTTENEIEYAPSLQAIQTLLFHYDPEWRKTQQGIKEDEDGIPRNIDHGISVESWLKKEMEHDGAN